MLRALRRSRLKKMLWPSTELRNDELCNLHLSVYVIKLGGTSDRNGEQRNAYVILFGKRSRHD